MLSAKPTEQHLSSFTVPSLQWIYSKKLEIFIDFSPTVIPITHCVPNNMPGEKEGKGEALLPRDSRQMPEHSPH